MTGRVGQFAAVLLTALAVLQPIAAQFCPCSCASDVELVANCSIESANDCDCCCSHTHRCSTDLPTEQTTVSNLLACLNHLPCPCPPDCGCRLQHATKVAVKAERVVRQATEQLQAPVPSVFASHADWSLQSECFGNRDQADLALNKCCAVLCRFTI